MGSDETIIGRPPPESGVPRGYTCEFCPELRERVTETHTMAIASQDRLIHIESKLDEAKSASYSAATAAAGAASAAAGAASAAALHSRELRDAMLSIVERDKNVAVELAILKNQTRNTAALVSGIVAGCIAFAYWAVDKLLGK